ncbi:hypothetical protein ACFYW6_07110 [Streptomyces sp. NPDC002659]|uniref:hypothetical protein n=1 Tax=Streptomyces sp. NPDC002659 TaxID=3364656 RepID=UPI0036932CCA
MITLVWSVSSLAVSFTIGGSGEKPLWLTAGERLNTVLLIMFFVRTLIIFLRVELGLQPRRQRSRSALRITSMAAHLAGCRRGLRNAWFADLAGDPENGLALTPREQRHLAAGFVMAALRMRAHDLLGGLWRPVDWLLVVETRTQGLIAAVVGAQAIYIVRDGGLSALVTEVWEPCAILGGGLYVLTRWLRRVRGIELAGRAEPPRQ